MWNLYYGKINGQHFKQLKGTSNPLELIDSDVCNLKFVQKRCENKYFISFINNWTKYFYVYLLKRKGEDFMKVALYKNEVENQLNKKIKSFKSDRCDKYEKSILWVLCKYIIINEVTMHIHLNWACDIADDYDHYVY